MKVAFYDIPGNALQVRLTDSEWLPEDTTFSGTVTAEMTIRRTGEDRVELSGILQVAVVATCDRCCRPATIPIQAEFLYHCQVGNDDRSGGSETECRDEDCSILYLREPVIDIFPLLREQLYLAHPQQVLCQANCRGLCQSCGCDLNEATCSCRPLERPGPFAALGILKKK